MWKTIITLRFSDTDVIQHISNIAILNNMKTTHQEMFKNFISGLDPKSNI